jgi:hypothetical protein
MYLPHDADHKTIIKTILNNQLVHMQVAGLPASPEGLYALQVQENSTYPVQLEYDDEPLNGTTQVRAGAVRPEIIVPGAAPVESAAVTDVMARGLTLGASVRLIRFPFFGLHGQVTELPHSLERIETGAHARVLRVRLSDGRVVTVPRANVELL